MNYSQYEQKMELNVDNDFTVEDLNCNRRYFRTGLQEVGSAISR